jgi:outer membrane protein assembly factor BamA
MRPRQLDGFLRGGDYSTRGRVEFRLNRKNIYNHRLGLGDEYAHTSLERLRTAVVDDVVGRLEHTHCTMSFKLLIP